MNQKHIHAYECCKWRRIFLMLCSHVTRELGHMKLPYTDSVHQSIKVNVFPDKHQLPSVTGKIFYITCNLTLFNRRCRKLKLGPLVCWTGALLYPTPKIPPLGFIAHELKELVWKLQLCEPVLRLKTGHKNIRNALQNQNNSRPFPVSCLK